MKRSTSACSGQEKGRGLFGGTFDPVHRGHLLAAEKVRRAFDLEEIVFIPCAAPPHKGKKRITGAEDRLAMLRLALEGRPGFSVSDCELRRSGPSYTVDTVRYFMETSPKNNPMYLILGQDAFLEIHTWKAFETILEWIPLIVMPRPGCGVSSSAVDGHFLEPFISSSLFPDYRRSKDGTRYTHPMLKPVYLFEDGLSDISSTKIRKTVKAGGRITALVPEAVEAYILEKGLYR